MSARDCIRKVVLMSVMIINNLEDLEQYITNLRLDIPVEHDLSYLGKPVTIGNRIAPNSIAIHPMEGADGEQDGSPSELTFERYRSFAAGGAGVIWMEAVAVVQDGRANPRQLFLNARTKDAFSRLVEETKEAALKSCGHEPLLIVQLTHSGRYSKPTGQPQPVIAYYNAYLDKASELSEGYPLVADNYLKDLIDRFGEAARFAKEAGFDGVDIKSCHGYLLAELLSGFNRPGQFGGDYDRRTKLLRETVQHVHADHGNQLLVGVRLNLFDGLPKPNGWGASENGEVDFSEPQRLIQELVAEGVSVFNATAGNPYYQPHINRPYSSGGYKPPESPLVGVERLMKLSNKMQEVAGDVPVIGVGFSFLRSAGPYVAAAAVKQGNTKMAGFGRLAFAYPDFPKQILQDGPLTRSQTCTACSGCTNLMRAGQTTGCIIRNSYYRNLWRDVARGGVK